MEWVIDASLTMSWCFEDEKTAQTEAFLDRLTTTPAVTPQIWPFEVGNVLAIAIRRGRLTVSQREKFISMLKALPISIDVQSGQEALGRSLALADAHRLTLYDASYLELAQRWGFHWRLWTKS